MDKTLIGRKIREARIAHGYTQEKLAELVSMHEKHISRIELGKFLPNLSNLIKIFKVLDIEIPKRGLDIVVPENNDVTKTELLKLINNSTSNELEFYLSLLKHVKKALGKYCSIVKV